MMKNSALLMVTFAMFAFCPLGRAQDQQPTIDSTIAVVRANMQADRTTLITTGMNFNDKDGAAFWPIYSNTSTNDPSWMIVALPSSRSTPRNTRR